MVNYLFGSYDSVSNKSGDDLANQKPPITTALQNENGALDLFANMPFMIFMYKPQLVYTVGNTQKTMNHLMIKSIT